MSKQATKGKVKPLPKLILDTDALHDILNKVRSNQKQTDKKFEELSLMCSGKQCKVK